MSIACGRKHDAPDGDGAHDAFADRKRYQVNRLPSSAYKTMTPEEKRERHRRLKRESTHRRIVSNRERHREYQREWRRKRRLEQEANLKAFVAMRQPKKAKCSSPTVAKSEQKKATTVAKSEQKKATTVAKSEQKKATTTSGRERSSTSGADRPLAATEGRRTSLTPATEGRRRSAFGRDGLWPRAKLDQRLSPLRSPTTTTVGPAFTPTKARCGMAASMAPVLTWENGDASRLHELLPRHGGWDAVFDDEAIVAETKRIGCVLQQEHRDGAALLPTMLLIFFAFDWCPFDQLQTVVVVGDRSGEPPHDGYHGQRLPYSLETFDGTPDPLIARQQRRALTRLHVELVSYNDYEVDHTCGCKPPCTDSLYQWTMRGALLLRVSPTTRRGTIGAHGKLWERWVHLVLHRITALREHLAILAFGKRGRAMVRDLPRRRHDISAFYGPDDISPDEEARQRGAGNKSDLAMETAKEEEEGPMSQKRLPTFIGCKCFRLATNYRRRHGGDFDWSLRCMRKELEAEKAVST